MPLPMTSGMLSVPNTYPDRIQLNYQYHTPFRMRVQTFCTRLQNLGFRTMRSGEGYRGEITVDGRPNPIPLLVSYSRRSWNINVFATISPLRDYRSLAGRRRIVERPINGDQNWLHARQIGEDNSAVVTYTHELLDDLENRLAEFISDTLPGDRIARPENVRGFFVHSAEIAIDLHSENPLQQIHHWQLPFRRHFRHVRRNGYRDTAGSFDALDGDIPMIHGFSRKEERYKIYPKTNRRVRLECQVGLAAFRRMEVRRNLHDYPQGFIGFYRAIARQVVPQFNSFLSDTTEVSDDELLAINFLVALGNACRDISAAQEIARVIIREGRITSAFGSRRLTNLTTAGLFTRSERGIYAPAPRWRPAVQALSSLMTDNIHRETA